MTAPSPYAGDRLVTAAAVDAQAREGLRLAEELVDSPCAATRRLAMDMHARCSAVLRGRAQRAQEV